jgi:molybdopterin-containing oxidoreductase family membrane subunit
MDRALLITGFFAEEDACLHGIAAVRRAGLELGHVFSPFPSERIVEAVDRRPSPVRLWVLLGGIAGCLSGFWLTIGLSLEYPHRTAGMPIVSIPPFVIIAFELTILFGALSGLLGFLVHGRFPQLAPVRGYDVRFSADRFGVVVECPLTDRPQVERLLRQAGASEVTCEASDGA